MENTAAQLRDDHANFAEAILDGAPLIVPAGKGFIRLNSRTPRFILRGQIERWNCRSTQRPYEKALHQKIAESKFEKKVVATSAEDFTKSFYAIT
jgi:hypothetical protein